jgi:hypothetical protein
MGGDGLFGSFASLIWIQILTANHAGPCQIDFQNRICQIAPANMRERCTEKVALAGGRDVGNDDYQASVMRLFRIERVEVCAIVCDKSQTLVSDFIH